LLRPDADAPGWNVIEKVKVDLQTLQLDHAAIPWSNKRVSLANLLGNADLPGNLKEVIVEKAQGNPFFVEELIRSLLETEQLTRENGQWQLAADNAQISLPNTLRGVLSARIDRLPDTARSVLQSASVIGRI
jgi:predicted ATPase